MFFPRIWPYCPYFNQILHLKGQTATLVSIQHMLPQARGFLELLYDVPDQTKSYLWRLTPGILQHFLHTKSYTDSHYSVLTGQFLLLWTPHFKMGSWHVTTGLMAHHTLLTYYTYIHEYSWTNSSGLRFTVQTLEKQTVNAWDREGWGFTEGARLIDARHGVV